MALAQQRILVVGGTSGMGLATARRLAQTDAEVFVSGRDAARLRAACAVGNGRIRGVAADFTQAHALADLFDQVGQIDHLVLAASGHAAWGPFAQVGADALRQALEHKLIGYWQTLQAALPRLRRDGSAVLLTGAASRTAIPGTAGLAAVNGAITQMAQTLARELAPLRVNVVSPGLVDTPVYDAMPADARAGLFSTTAASLPVGRTGTAEEIAAVVEMLLDNAFVTGALIDVDGGARMPL